jgi:1,4-dihydroxy-2-naphthoate octaprenyltransferase
LNSFASDLGLLSVGVLNLNNMRDEASDRKVGKNTLVVKIGGKSKVIPLLFSNFAMALMVVFAIINNLSLTNTCFTGLYSFNQTFKYRL